MGHDQEDGTRGTAQSGLRRLMLKLPAFRRHWHVQAGSSSSTVLQELFQAYDEACLALEAFRRERDHPLVAEYENVCAELEADITRELGL
jgi:hypothetical protein